MLELVEAHRAGRSTARRHRELDKAWRRRTFGSRTAIYAWLLYTALVLLASVHMPHWMLFVGLALGSTGALLVMTPDVFRPAHIRRWQLGSWGEQMTAAELRRLPRSEWTVRHDIRWKGRANHDHVVVGAAAFVINTKNLRDSRVTVDGESIRIEQIENPDDRYVAESWVSVAMAESYSLRRVLSGAAGFPVYVYPVIAVWGAFAPGEMWIGNVALVQGDRLTDFIRGRPADLLDDAKRRLLADAVKTLPRASK